MGNTDKILQDKDYLNIYPITRERNVYDENNVNLKTKFENVVFNDNDVHKFAQELYDESYNILDVSKFIGTSGFESAKLEDNGYEITGATGSADAWSYANSNVKLTLEAGTYYLNYDIASSNSNSALNIFKSNNSVIRYGKGSFTLTEKTDIGIMVKVFAGGSLKINITPTTTMMNYQKFNPNRHITNPQAEFLKEEFGKQVNEYEYPNKSATVSGATYSINNSKFNIKGTTTSAINISIFDFLGKLEVGKTYSISSNVAYNNPNFNYSVALTYSVNGSTTTEYITPNSPATIKTGLTRAMLNLYAPSGITFNHSNVIFMVYEGTKKLEAQEYNSASHITNSQANLLKSEWEKSKNFFHLHGNNFNSNGLNFAFNKDGTFNAIGTPSKLVEVDLWVPINESGLVNGKTYTMSSNGGGDFHAQTALYVDKNTWYKTPFGLGAGGWIKTVQLEIPNNITYVRHLLQFKAGVQYNLTNAYAQLEEGSVATPYNDWNGQIIHEKDIKPIILFEGNSSNDVPLSQPRTKFDFLKITYRDNGDTYNFVEIPTYINKTSIIVGDGDSWENHTYIKIKNINISDNQISHSGYGELTFKNTNVTQSVTSNNIYITKVEGGNY